MKKIALGLVTAAAVFNAVPAMAQIGYYAGPRGVGVGLAVPGSYYDCGYYSCGRRYYDYYGSPTVEFGGGSSGSDPSSPFYYLNVQPGPP